MSQDNESSRNGDQVERIADIFRTGGQPTVTYVRRDHGRFEAELESALLEPGQICLVTGPSKTGKTTLYKQVLSNKKFIALHIYCSSEMSATDVWLRILEKIDFERVSARKKSRKDTLTLQGEANTTFGWSWLAKSALKVGVSKGSDASEEEARERILSSPGPELLIPVLQETNYILVFEDFHYLHEAQQKLLAEQWKKFTDNDISFLVVGTTHRAVDIVRGNKDLIGRITHFKVGNWSISDLEEIVKKGFQHIDVKIKANYRSFIAAEAVGLPIVVQQVCLELFLRKGITEKSQVDRSLFNIDDADISAALNAVAKKRYESYENFYAVLVRGPRQRARKYNSYELLIACFGGDPVKFQLTRGEIDDRIRASGLEQNKLPPTASIQSALRALDKHQQRKFGSPSTEKNRGLPGKLRIKSSPSSSHFRLLEWREKEDTLYILEPTFLFYVRWRNARPVSRPKLQEWFDIFLKTKVGNATEEVVRVRVRNPLL
ncbi:ATP-binding protein [Roseomonas sp. AR75]|uniref:ATP-binding protein n=1 Tax=Roseomonas sp. AR75 TaxID=2562311 RepID=UPI001484F611|nr:ATP-binding protein [Roseomonas sp. AR75]